ncbi:MAG: alpha-amylase/4-alpha-glucanotransferase domain-containing protein [Planctomycetales bacterium]
MSAPLRLVLAIHDHQPVGNFDGVFDAACRDSYAPFLEVLADYPEIPVALHHSGSLLEWLAAHRPEYLDRVRGLVERGQIEILGGAFYEPILAAIPARDRVGQIAAFSRYLERLFGTPVRGMWVPERVWEPGFTHDIARAGIEYTVLDDFHFRCAGLRDDELTGYYLTEDEGSLLKIFPGSERLRYTIPFADPQQTVDYLREIADRRPNAVIAFGDDGEKFGTWPGTKKHVYEDGWLRRFFDALRDNREWLKVVTPAEAVDHVSPVGKIYLPESSYREMTEWALPTPRQVELRDLIRRHEHDHGWSDLRQFVRGGFWRNFRVKYPECNEMYARMLEISRRLESLDQKRADDAPLDAARIELYRAQCNCAYWHGAFGGLYLPHLRNAVYRHLIAADTLLEQAAERPPQWVEIEAADFDLDARQEIRLAGSRLIAWLDPAQGGHLYELDVRNTKHNLLATLDRRPEPYHDTIREAVKHRHGDGDGHVASIHDAVRFKQPDLDRHLVYDRWRRKSLVDHFFRPDATLADVQAGHGELGDFAAGVYTSVLRRSDERVEARMTRHGHVGPYRIRVTKTVGLSADAASRLDIAYELEDLPPDVPLVFAVEFNFAGMAAGASDRYYYDEHGRQLGQLETALELEDASRIGLVDEWLGMDVSLESSRPAAIWAHPVQTVSQSEGGFELVHQSAAVIPRWELRGGDEGRWSVQLALAIDTSAAQARSLREVGAEAALP